MNSSFNCPYLGQSVLYCIAVHHDIGLDTLISDDDSIQVEVSVDEARMVIIAAG